MLKRKKIVSIRFLPEEWEKFSKLINIFPNHGVLYVHNATLLVHKALQDLWDNHFKTPLESVGRAPDSNGSVTFVPVVKRPREPKGKLAHLHKPKKGKRS